MSAAPRELTASADERVGGVHRTEMLDRPGSTALTLLQERITLMPPFDTTSVTTGWNQALDKLAALYERS